MFCFRYPLSFDSTSIDESMIYVCVKQGVNDSIWSVEKVPALLNFIIKENSQYNSDRYVVVYLQLLVVYLFSGQEFVYSTFFIGYVSFTFILYSHC